MKTRPLEERDVPFLRALYDEANLEDDWPDLGEFVEAQVIVDEHDEPVACAAVRMVPEMMLILGKAHPAAKLHWLRVLHKLMLAWMSRNGYRRVLALVPPKIARPYARRLGAFGWVPGFASFIYRTEDVDVIRERCKEERPR